MKPGMPSITSRRRCSLSASPMNAGGIGGGGAPGTLAASVDTAPPGLTAVHGSAKPRGPLLAARHRTWRSPLPQPYDTALQRQRHRLRAVPCAELLQDALQVVLDRLARPPDDAGDLLVPQPVRDQLQQLLLARG